MRSIVFQKDGRFQVVLVPSLVNVDLKSGTRENIQAETLKQKKKHSSYIYYLPT